MAIAELCDICEKRIKPEMYKTYKYQVRAHSGRFDGFSPIVNRQRLDICPDCMKVITKIADKKLKKEKN